MRSKTLVLLCLFAMACGRANEPETGKRLLPRLDRLGTLGCADCDGPESIVPVGIDIADGRVFVRDEYEPLVRVFDLAGGLELTFGNFGQGPGELSPVVTPIFVAANGNVLAYDLAKLQAFDAQGRFVGAWPWPPRVPFAFQYERVRNRLFILGAPMGEGGLDRDGVEVTAYHPGEDDFGPHTAIAFDDLPLGTRDGEERPIAAAVAARRDGRLVLADDEAYRFYWYRSDGQRDGEFGRDIPPPPLTPREIERAREIQAMTDTRRDLPESAPHFSSQGIFFDGLDRLWVQTLRWSGEGEDRVETIFDLFDPDGHYMGEVIVPVVLPTGRYPVLALRGDLLVGGYLEEDFNWRVGVWRIVG